MLSSSSVKSLHGVGWEENTNPTQKPDSRLSAGFEGGMVKGTGLFSALHSHGSQEIPDRQEHRTKLKQEAWAL